MNTTGRTNEWDRLVLVGFMGAGKSTVGALLAPRLNFLFLDSDKAIEQTTGKSISELFEERGEVEFRLLEAQIIADLLTRKHGVIALGGGALEDPVTRDMLQHADHTCVVHLEAPLATLLERCRETAPTRPLLKDERSLMQRHAARLKHYRIAHLTIVTEGRTPQAVVEELLRELASAPQWSISPPSVLWDKEPAKP